MFQSEVRSCPDVWKLEEIKKKNSPSLLLRVVWLVCCVPDAAIGRI